MPAKTEKQRRFMAMCSHGGRHKLKCPEGMSKAQMRDFSFKPRKKGK